MNHDESPFAVIARHQKEPPVSVSAIAADLGLEVRRIAMDKLLSGMIKPDDSSPSNYVIFINSNDPITRQRFTAAHEIAHFVLHRDLIEDGVIDDTMYRSFLPGPYETQANQLASDILMPIRLIKKYREQNPNSDWNEIAKVFGVSPEAMKIRLKNMRFSGELPTTIRNPT